MFCPKCGKQMPDGSRFCTNCGEPFAQPEPQPVYVEPAPYEEPMYAEETVLLSEDEFPAQQTAHFAPEEPQAPKAPKSKKTLAIILGAVGVVLLAAAVLIVCSLSSPKATVLRAFGKSGSELEKLFESSENFSAFMEHLEGIAETGEFGLSVDYELEMLYDGDTYSSSITMQGGRTDKELGIYYEMSEVSTDTYYNTTERQEAAISLYADKDELCISLPDVLDDSYSLPLKKLGQKLMDSDLGDLLLDEMDDDAEEILETLDVDLFADLSWDAFKKYDSKTAKALENSLEIEKSSKRIPEADRDLKVYCITVDTDALVDVVEPYYEFYFKSVLGDGSEEYVDDILKEMELDELTEILEDVELEVYVGIGGGCVKALHIVAEVDGDEESVTVLLDGKDNIWEDILVYADEELTAEITIEPDRDGFELTVDADGEEFIVLCDDSAGELSFEADGEELFALEYGAKDKGCQVIYQVEYEYDSDWFSYAYSMDVSVELSPKATVEKPKKSVNLLELDEDELEDLLDEAEDALDDLF